jgi:hypothetical protein
MNLPEIIQREKENVDKIYIYQECNHYVSFECSAYFLTRVLSDCNICEEEYEFDGEKQLLLKVDMKDYFQDLLPSYLYLEKMDDYMLLKARKLSYITYPFSQWREEYERMKMAEERRVRKLGRGLFGFLRHNNKNI